MAIAIPRFVYEPKGFESLWGDGKNGNEIKPGHASYSAYVVAENADEYQDTFEKGDGRKILSIRRLVLCQQSG